ATTATANGTSAMVSHHPARTSSAAVTTATVPEVTDRRTAASIAASRRGGPSLRLAEVAHRGDFFGEPGGVGAAGVEPLVQVRLERIQQATAITGLDQQLVDALGAGEALHGCRCV